MRKIKNICYIIISAWIIFSLNCQTPSGDKKYVRDGKQYGVVKGLFRARWWNFYERGISFSDGQFWEEAIADFKAAIKQRDKDQRRARTYGMHFLEYFPHRELGVVYYHLGRHEDARRELENSLSSVDTGKAKFYLNKVRKALIEASKADTAPPKIRVASLTGGEITNRFKLKFEGDVEDDLYAHKIAINEEPQFIELSAKKIPFSKEIKLKKGLNEIKIKTSDLLGKVTERKVKVFADFEGPALNIKNFTDGQKVSKNRVVLHGALADATGITTLKINDKVLAYNKEREVTFAFAVDLKEGDNKIALAATDIAGNTTRGALKLAYVPKLADKQQNTDKSPDKPFGGKGLIRVAFQGSGVIDTGQNTLFAAAGTARKESAFRLNLKDLADTQTVYYDTMYVDGSASGTNKIQSVRINDSPMIIIPGKTVYFNQLIELKKGENRFTFEVEDAKGNKTSKTIRVLRVVPKVHQIGSRMSLAILPFVPKGETSMVSNTLYDNIVSGFIDQNRFNIVSRGEELEAVLRELKLSKTDLVDKSTAVKVGRLVAAEGILMGTIHETENSLEVYARLVNTETSTIFDAKDVYGQDKSLSQIRYLTNGLALKFKHSFPLLEGMVIKVSKDSIYADFGSTQQIKKEMKFIVFREGETIVHPVTGKVLGSETEELGVATVVNVYKDMSMGKLRSEFDPSAIKVKDLVITK